MEFGTARGTRQTTSRRQAIRTPIGRPPPGRHAPQGGEATRQAPRQPQVGLHLEGAQEGPHRGDDQGKRQAATPGAHPLLPSRSRRRHQRGGRHHLLQHAGRARPQARRLRPHRGQHRGHHRPLLPRGHPSSHTRPRHRRTARPLLLRRRERRGRRQRPPPSSSSPRGGRSSERRRGERDRRQRSGERQRGEGGASGVGTLERTELSAVVGGEGEGGADDLDGGRGGGGRERLERRSAEQERTGEVERRDDSHGDVESDAQELVVRAG
mmetsp:Transcript_30454/g.65781  ORF Transcript_30454/g.65781 Transcript_30454/m.65781 type:complete len:268 (-) Transcript_30454:661-1464(-)